MDDDRSAVQCVCVYQDWGFSKYVGVPSKNSLQVNHHLRNGETPFGQR